jgi:L-malate glycosyltransferase
VGAGRSVHLVLVGSGGTSFDNCDAELHAYVEQNGLAGTVTFAGEVENVPEYLQASDLFVFPSEYEGFPLSLFEAMACGLPVASTRVGSAREILVDREHGALAEPKNREQMRAAIEWLLDHPEEWPGIRERVRRLVVERFSLDAVTDQYAALFEEVVATR